MFSFLSCQEWLLFYFLDGDSGGVTMLSFREWIMVGFLVIT